MSLPGFQGVSMPSFMLIGPKLWALEGHIQPHAYTLTNRHTDIPPFIIYIDFLERESTNAHEPSSPFLLIFPVTRCYLKHYSVRQCSIISVSVFGDDSRIVYSSNDHWNNCFHSQRTGKQSRIYLCTYISILYIRIIHYS